MKYMLDTNIIVYARNNRPEEVLRRFNQYDSRELCISAITMAELEYGVCNSSKPEQNQLALMLFLSNIEIVPFGSLAAMEYGRIRHDLKQKGELIGGNDLLIAAHAKAIGATLVTANTREFDRVSGLQVDNWM